MSNIFSFDAWGEKMDQVFLVCTTKVVISDR